MPHIIDLEQLTDAERLELIGDLWDSLSTQFDDRPITAQFAAELDRRIGEYEKNPESASTWEEVEKSILDGA